MSDEQTVTVSRDPTPKMIAAAVTAYRDVYDEMITREEIIVIWQAMIDRIAK
jgi:hypothetical protein